MNLLLNMFPFCVIKDQSTHLPVFFFFIDEVKKVDYLEKVIFLIYLYLTNIYRIKIKTA
jgi:hypothetical protein